jgi:hypothetical protein
MVFCKTGKLVGTNKLVSRYLLETSIATSVALPTRCQCQSENASRNKNRSHSSMSLNKV